MIAITSVLCACGAQWTADHVELAAAVIACHKARWSTGAAGCGPISHDAFRSQWLCLCDACRDERIARRVALRREQAEHEQRQAERRARGSMGRSTRYTGTQ